jgi:hypothetical protein
MTYDEAIKRCKNIRDGAVAVLDTGFGTHEGESDILYRRRVDFAETCISALREQTERENPQPLTLERLRKMDGEPVYCIGIINFALSGWGTNNVKNEQIVDGNGDYWDFKELGKSYNAYRYKPKEAIK